MATVGQRLTTPESGWKRYDDSYYSIKREGTGWNNLLDAGLYNGGCFYTYSISGIIKFNFIGSKIRIITSVNTSNTRATNTIYIDGVPSQYSTVNNSQILQVLVFEKTNLSNDIHTVEIKNDVDTKSLSLDAIDIDSDGRLLHPDEVTDPKDLEIGKRIRCHYQAPTSGQVGTFSNLGQETYINGINDFIPPASSATSNGDFYYICVDKDFLGRWKLIADRNVQHSISWDTLNSGGIASGSGIKTRMSTVPTLTSNTSNGIAFVDSIYSTATDAWNAFDNNKSTRWSSLKGVSGQYGFVGYIFNEPKVINGIKIVTYADCPPTDFKIQGSLDTTNGSDGNWVDLVIGLNTNINGIYYFDFDNKNNYKSYRIYAPYIKNNVGNYYLGLVDMELYERNDSYAFATRLLTGGISTADKDNEWDQYIVNSTLNGLITAGDNNTWNASPTIRSWTSTVATTSSTDRTQRGGTSISTWVNRHSTNTGTADSFRPVLLVEELSSPPIFNGDININRVHREDVILSGGVFDKDNEMSQYRILVNGDKKYPLNYDYTNLELNPFIYFIIDNEWLNIGNNIVELELLDSSNESINYQFQVEKFNFKPFDTNFSITPNEITRGNVMVNGVISNIKGGYKKDESWEKIGEVFIKPIFIKK